MERVTEEKSYHIPICDRIPTLNDLRHSLQEDNNTTGRHIRIEPCNYTYKHLYKDPQKHSKKQQRFYSFCILSVCLSFILGFVIGILIVGMSQVHLDSANVQNVTSGTSPRNLNSLRETRNILLQKNAKSSRFSTVSFVGNDKHRENKEDTQPIGLADNLKNILKDSKYTTSLNNSNIVTDNTVLFENIYWGPEIENSIPQGYGLNSAEIWERYVNQSEIVSMKSGCGRMQNRLVTFKDGMQACVRYRQNTDQIQGEIFSFYVAKLLNLTNLAPSVVKIVDVKDKLWAGVVTDVSAAEWNSNRAVVLTQYIPSLEPANIPDIFKPSSRHLNKHDVLSISSKENKSLDASKQILKDNLKMKADKTPILKQNFDHIDMNLNKKTKDIFVELAQWSDLIIFDYLTANLDRIVNNLFNFQWNVNIMNGPAHNLARKMDSGLLIFLDNESGLLHGYRLLKKYNIYHSIMLDNLCVFRKKTVDSLKALYSSNIGALLNGMFNERNSAVIRDILPPLPEKNAKILHERIGHVLGQVEQCQVKYSNK